MCILAFGIAALIIGITSILCVIECPIEHQQFHILTFMILVPIGIGAVAWWRHLRDWEDPQYRNEILIKALEKNNILAIYALVAKKYSLWFTDDVMEWYAEKGKIEESKSLWKFLHENKKDPLPEDAMDAWIWFRERGWKICRHEVFGCCDGTYDFHICSGDAPDSDIAFLRQYLNENWSLIRIPFKKAKDIRDALILHDKEKY